MAKSSRHSNLLFISIILVTTTPLISNQSLTPAPAVNTRNTVNAEKDIPTYLSSRMVYSDRRFRLHNLYTQVFNTSIFKVVLDEQSRDIFVGGRNFIFRLHGKDLNLTDYVSNGPVKDNSNCKPPPIECRTTSKVLTDQDNKVLLLNYATQPYPTVISCGTTAQGMCSLHKYVYLKATGIFGSPADPVNYIASRKNTIAFMAPHPNGTISTVIVASEYDGRNLSYSPPLLSARTITVSPWPVFNFTHLGRENSSLDIHPRLKESFAMRFIYGFHYQGYAYFVVNQRLSSKSSDFETRLGRVCLADQSFVSYSEIPIKCESQSQTYLLSTAASLGKSGEKQYRIFNSTTSNNDVLFVSFMMTLQGRGETVDMNEGSVICGFNMKTVQDSFYQAAEECFSGARDAYLLEAFYGERRSCTRNKLTDQALCGQSVHNHYIEGSEPLTAFPLLKMKKSKVTSLASLVQGKDTIIVMGTTEGNFSKAVLATAAETHGEILYNEQLYVYVQSNDGKNPVDSQVQRDPVITEESGNTYAYFASGQQVTKFPLSSCSIYSACGKCVTSNDPLNCGWCGNHCAHRNECRQQPSRDTCSPVIYSFHPNKGPFAGGTEIVIEGDSFGHSQSGGSLKVQISGIDCEVKVWTMDKIRCITKSVKERPPHGLPGLITVTATETSRSHRSFVIRGSSTSESNFTFLEASVSSIIPLFGPESGGTDVIISGRNLDIGSTRTVKLGRTLCLEKSSNQTHLICQTQKFVGSSLNNHTHAITVLLDRLEIKTSYNFTFMSNPKLENFNPKGATCSGDNPVTWTGHHLTSITNPNMVVTFEGGLSRTGPCSIQNDTHMVCLTPACPSNRMLSEHEKRAEYVQIFMDGNPVVDQPRQSTLIYHPDPRYYRFNDGSQEVYVEEPIVEISGNDINVDYAINITVGSDNLPCDVLEQHERTKFWCRIQFQGVTPSVGDVLHVNYQIGETEMNGVLGNVVFSHKPSNGLSGVLLTTVIFLIFAFMVVLAALLYFRSKKNPSKKQRSFEVIFTNHDRPGMSANGKYIFPAVNLDLTISFLCRLRSWFRQIRSRSEDPSHRFSGINPTI